MQTTAEALSIIKGHVVEVQKDGNRTLRVKCDSAYYANNIISSYIALYGVPNVGDAGFHFLNTDRFAYPKFTDTDMRDDALQLTQDLIDGKEVTVGSGTVTVGPNCAVDNPPTTTTVAADDDAPEKKTDWTTYIIIGAAAVVILLLLFDRKKK